MVWCGPRLEPEFHSPQKQDARNRNEKVINAMKKPSRGPPKKMMGVTKQTHTANKADEVMKGMTKAMKARGDTEARRHVDVGKIVFKVSTGRAHHSIGEVVDVDIRQLEEQHAWTLAYAVRFENDEIVLCDADELVMIKQVDA
jgi:hypothetical protein